MDDYREATACPDLLLYFGLCDEAYWWLRDHTQQLTSSSQFVPATWSSAKKTRQDARVMAWWDYGYQSTDWPIARSSDRG